MRHFYSGRESITSLIKETLFRESYSNFFLLYIYALSRYYNTIDSKSEIQDISEQSVQSNFAYLTSFYRIDVARHL